MLRGDARLLARAARGDAAAFGEFYDHHAVAAMSMAYRIVGDRNMAEDVCQEAFLGIWRSALSYDPHRGAVRAWVLGSVRNRAIDAVRHRAVHRRPLVPSEPRPETWASEDLIEDRVLRDEAGRAIRLHLDALPSAQREAIALAYYAGLTHAQIATLVDVPIGTVKGRIRLGLCRLRDGPDNSAFPGRD